MSGPFVIDANLDCESRWSGLALPPAVTQRISLYGTLLSVLAPAGADVELWTPAPVNPAHLNLPRTPTLRVGTPPQPDLAWADPSSRAANDRRLAHAVATRLGIALPGERVITTVDEIDLAGPWIAKPPWTAAGRDRCRGSGAPTVEQRTWLEHLLASGGALVVEPWCDRVLDVGVCAKVDHEGRVTAKPPHGLVTDVHGKFHGIDLAAATLEPEERVQLDESVVAAGQAIAETGTTGRFAIDAFAYRDGNVRRFRPLCEINARTTFGWIAWAFAAVSGTTRLGFGTPPPGATVLIATGAADNVTAWVG